MDKAKELLSTLSSPSNWLRISANPARANRTSIRDLPRSDPALFEPVLVAIATGMTWLAEQDLPALLMQKHPDRLRVLQLLQELCQHLSDALALLRAPGMPQAQAERKGRQVAALAAQTGLLQAFGPMCSSLTSAIDTQRRNNPATAHASLFGTLSAVFAGPIATSLAAALVTLFCRLAQVVDSRRLLLSPQLAPAVPAVAAATVAALRSKGDSGVETATAFDIAHYSKTLDTSNTEVALLSSVLCESYAGGSSSSADSSSAAALAGSSSVREVLLLALALTAGTVHEQLQQQQLLPYHLRLLKVLGVGDALPEPYLKDARPSDVLNSSFLELLALSLASSSASSSSTTTSTTGTAPARRSRRQQQEEEEEADAAASLFATVQLVLAQCMAVQPEPATMSAGLAAMLQLCQHTSTAAVNTAGAAGAASSAGGPSASMTLLLLLGVLRQLLPAVRQAEAAAGSSRAGQAADATPAAGQLFAGLASLVMLLTRRAQAFDNTADALADVFLRHVPDYSWLLEAHIRGCLQAGRQAELSADVQAVASLVEPAALTSSMQQSSNAGGSSFGSMLLPPPQNAFAAPQLHALLVTSLKAAAAAVADGAAAQDGDCQPCWVMSHVVKVMNCCVLGSSTSVSSGGDTVPQWAMLLARCLVSAAREAQRLQQQMLGGPAGGAWADPARRSSLASKMSQLAYASCSRAVHYIHLQLPLMARTPGAAAAAGSLLQQHEDRLSRQVGELQAAADAVVYDQYRAGAALRAAGGARGGEHGLAARAGLDVLRGPRAADEAESRAAAQPAAEAAAAQPAAAQPAAAEPAAAEPAAADPAAAEPAADATTEPPPLWSALIVAAGDLASGLAAAGAAVAAELPVPECCNNHDCNNLAQCSELELVGGAACVCSGCRVARYCSRECQVAHWRDWHKAVCKRMQQQQSQSQPAAAAGN